MEPRTDRMQLYMTASETNTYNKLKHWINVGKICFKS